jgi:hypothetical protein
VDDAAREVVSAGGDDGRLRSGRCTSSKRRSGTMRTASCRNLSGPRSCASGCRGITSTCWGIAQTSRRPPSAACWSGSWTASPARTSRSCRRRCRGSPRRWRGRSVDERRIVIGAASPPPTPGKCVTFAVTPAARPFGFAEGRLPPGQPARRQSSGRDACARGAARSPRLRRRSRYESQFSTSSDSRAAMR